MRSRVGAMRLARSRAAMLQQRAAAPGSIPPWLRPLFPAGQAGARPPRQPHGRGAAIESAAHQRLPAVLISDERGRQAVGRRERGDGRDVAGRDDGGREDARRPHAAVRQRRGHDAGAPARGARGRAPGRGRRAGRQQRRGPAGCRAEGVGLARAQGVAGTLRAASVAHDGRGVAAARPPTARERGPPARGPGGGAARLYSPLALSCASIRTPLMPSGAAAVSVMASSALEHSDHGAVVQPALVGFTPNFTVRMPKRVW
jgi:hypothetical protein